MSYQTIALLVGFSLGGCLSAQAQEAAAPSPLHPRLLENQLQMQLSHQPTGILIPLYLYPADIHTNAAWNRLIELKLEFPTVPVCVIVNPASGPGDDRDANYVKAVDRLYGAGIILVGYVSTEYARRPAADVRRDIARWGDLYPRIHGLFLDEMTNDVEDEGAEHIEHYAALTRHAHEQGYWPVIANPGAHTPGAYFDAPAADIIVIHEGRTIPDEPALKGDFFGGYADYPPFTRGVLIHSCPEWNADEFARIAKYTRWVYVTDDVYETESDNPWDSLSGHMEQMLRALATGGRERSHGRSQR